MRGGMVLREIDNGVRIQPKEQFLIIDTAPLLTNFRQTCLYYGETPAIDVGNPEELDIFMHDLYCQLECYTNIYTVEHLAKSIESCLERSQEYLGRSFTPLQKHIWMDVGREIVAMTFEYGLRDTRLISKYEYDKMMGLSMILKLYDE
jgi:hypothetical protein